jgi:pimeloyl-ACP methyl ester carboxylesterase
VAVGGVVTTETASLPPVIFIPGVAGTELESGGSQVWPLSLTTSMLEMALKPDGITPARSGTQITTGPILAGFPANFYGGFLSYLEGMGYTMDKDLYTFPYDWRLDNLQQLPALDTLVNHASASNQNAKVVLIAHSMGGLIAASYVLSSHSRAAKIASVVTMGTPYWGSPKVYYGLISGYTFGNPDASQWVMKDVLQNLPAAYELLPRDYTFVYDTSGSSIPLAQTYSIHYKAPGPFTQDQNTQQMNPALLQAKAKFDALMGPRASPTPLGVKQYVIIGTGVETLSTFSERAPNPGESFLYLGQNVAMDPRFGDGDGTVPIWGAETSTATDTYYVGYVNRFGLGTSLRDVSSAHGDLPGTRPSRG